ncbi:MAG: hypothetical protein KatS3mg012_1611 [Gaiellaceae bacterium]|jgi:hypothetical protein|nr:MAG: hypothetical protein KatS3mg012_1611 [Gaiellaceae bacterium]
MELLAQRLLLLAAAALVAATAALAVVERRSEPSTSEILAGLRAPVAWTTAFAGSRGPAGDALRTTCGQVLGPESLGVSHAVLPCGAKLVLRYRGKQVLTEVIDNALVEPGRQLEVTEALAELLGIEGTVELEWRFATEESG